MKVDEESRQKNRTREIRTKEEDQRRTKEKYNEKGQEETISKEDKKREQGK